MTQFLPIKRTKDDLKEELRTLKADISQIDQTFNSIKTWAKIWVGILTIAGGIIGGVVKVFWGCKEIGLPENRQADPFVI